MLLAKVPLWSYMVCIAGVPLVVARKMQQGPLLLGRLVTSVDAAVAAAAEGANFVLLQVCHIAFCASWHLTTSTPARLGMGGACATAAVQMLSQCCEQLPSSINQTGSADSIRCRASGHPTGPVAILYLSS